VLEYTGNLGKDRQLTAHQRGSTNGDLVNSTESDAIINTQTKHAEKDTKEEITLLDTLKVERERGITVKASAASMLYRHTSATNEDGLILLNMVDTPGRTMQPLRQTWISSSHSILCIFYTRPRRFWYGGLQITRQCRGCSSAV
jgi:hypothetical protein